MNFLFTSNFKQRMAIGEVSSMLLLTFAELVSNDENNLDKSK